MFSCIERLLNSLNVRNLVLPAADEAESIWTRKFGFNKLTLDEVRVLFTYSVWEHKELKIDVCCAPFYVAA